uniref:HD/PDEase domain-containing protein n=1 Tax=Aplanochytrium stocchinoi TaxID=215587 RepID=A0A7S3PRD3_9STRA|mmetsp:Transcript_2947/g.3432  ORF Transcript_2947/g.3432 Transcript_2947/m.3432 type:complete len:422 (-) Transcript_2947:17-1282(-)|eukprot:CAMPEP_0204844440 /NCGR_PEP_ID=MMETSP1347-20130617/214_1 /ASSEMBLY_ACC=CAM_ASM_000690 /TAXON_ID=215587 /ORGANISM="Aplanochytrium stocchinoi, Strain GSBS06" /LENGTH=421 /DNA_ID=CAMNT_0051983799 /DNA_START=201 /DNA_END=1466 /DNA_ORIENTATION=-
MNVRRLPSRNRGRGTNYSNSGGTIGSSPGIGQRLRQSMKALQSLVLNKDSLFDEEMQLAENRNRFVKGGVRTRSVNRKRSRKSTFGSSMLGSSFSTRGSRLPSDILKDDFEFSALSESPSRLTDIVVDMLMQTIVPTIDKQIDYHTTLLRISVLDLVNKIQEEYGNTSYHNFCHAADVTQLMFTLITKYFDERVAAHEPFFLLFICLCHDMGHPGASIEFLHENNLLTEYNSLEEYHIARTESLIDTHPIFSHYMDHELKMELLELSRVLIEATNIKQHSRISQRLHSIDFSGGKLREDHMILLIKLCDLANVVRRFEDAKLWAAGLTIETKAVEKLREKNVAQFCVNIKVVAEQLQHVQDKVRQSFRFDLPENMGPFTIGFINDTVKPMALLLNRLDENAGDEFNTRLNENINFWMRQEL